MGAIRRAYVYAVALVSLGVMAASVDDVLVWVMHNVFGTVARGDVPLLSVAGVIVQVPIWAIHWVIAQSTAARDPEDRRATVRRVYLVLAMAGAVGAGAIGLATIVRALIGDHGEDTVEGVAAVVTAVPLLIIHRRALVQDLSSQETRRGALIRHAYLAIAAGVAALIGLGSAAGLVAAVLERVFGIGADADGPDIATIAEMSGALVSASIVWAAHHRGRFLTVAAAGQTLSSRDEAPAFLPALYRVVVLTVAVAVTLGNVAALLDWAASWVVGPSLMPVLGIASGASLTIYGAAWWAFRRSLAHDLGATQGGPDAWLATLDRVHRYVVTVVALAVAATGIAQIVGMLLDTVSGAIPESGSYAREVRFWVAVTATGLPTWVGFWRPPGHPRLLLAEIASRPRRGALYLVVFACAVSLLTSGVWVTYGLLGMALGKPFDFPTVAVGATIVAAVVGAYHLSVLRSEAQVLAAQVPTPVSSVDATEPSAATPWAAIRSTSVGLTVGWYATAAEARAVATQADARWHAVARLDDGDGVPPDARTVVG